MDTEAFVAWALDDARNVEDGVAFTACRTNLLGA